MSVAALYILPERNEVLILLNNIRCIILLKNIMDSDQRGEILEFGNCTEIRNIIRHKFAEHVLVFIFDRKVKFAVITFEKSHRKKLADDYNITCLFIKRNITRAFAVSLNH